MDSSLLKHLNVHDHWAVVVELLLHDFAQQRVQDREVLADVPVVDGEDSSLENLGLVRGEVVLHSHFDGVARPELWEVPFLLDYCFCPKFIEKL